jgi:hypothetical protein
MKKALFALILTALLFCSSTYPVLANPEYGDAFYAPSGTTVPYTFTAPDGHFITTAEVMLSDGTGIYTSVIGQDICHLNLCVRLSSDKMDAWTFSPDHNPAAVIFIYYLDNEDSHNESNIIRFFDPTVPDLGTPPTPEPNPEPGIDPDPVHIEKSLVFLPMIVK